MTRKTAGWLLAAFVAGGLCACGSGKQDAAVKLDEARLSVAAARKAGAEASSPKRFSEAAAALSAAEAGFEGKNYAAATKASEEAVNAAHQAEWDAKNPPAKAKKPARAKRVAKK